MNRLYYLENPQKECSSETVSGQGNLPTAAVLSWSVETMWPKCLCMEDAIISLAFNPSYPNLHKTGTPRQPSYPGTPSVLQKRRQCHHLETGAKSGNVGPEHSSHWPLKRSRSIAYAVAKSIVENHLALESGSRDSSGQGRGKASQSFH